MLGKCCKDLKITNNMLDKFSVDMYDQMRKVDSAEDLSLDALFD